MTADLDPDHVVQEAARWLVQTPKPLRPRPVVVELKARFPLDAHGAIAALRLANENRGGVDVRTS